MITAREAVPGTKIMVTGSWCPMSGLGRVETVHAQITVARWINAGNGLAHLYDETGQHCGQYTADHEFAQTLGESMKLTGEL